MATPIPSNSCRFTLGEIAKATGAAFHSDPALAVKGVVIDSRVIAAGALFVALRGNHHDGHSFLGAVAERGAAAAVVERGRADGALPCLEVDNTLRALGALARRHLDRIRSVNHPPVIAIGGSAGKTTTKELTAALARSLFGPILATPGNLNNLVGVPMTLFTLTAEHRAAVIECGTNRHGEIAELARLLEPDVAVVLNVDIEHSEGLGALDEIAEEETALFRTARLAVASADEPMVTRRIPDGMKTLTFGAAAAADVRYIRATSDAANLTTIFFRLNPMLLEPGLEPRLEARLKLVGAAAAANAAAALSAVIAAAAAPLGRAQLDGLARSLATVEPVAGRLCTRMVAGVVVIDDTYNANPRSVRIAIDAAREMARRRNTRLLIALGDMLELGPLSEEMHLWAVREAALARPDVLIAVGPATTAACDAAGMTVGEHLVQAPDSHEGAELVRDIVKPGDVFLVKGSRGIEMERLIMPLEAGSRS